MAYDIFCTGAVWHGPWHTGLIEGHFGYEGKQHYAMRGGCWEMRVFQKVTTFFPFTSKDHEQFLLRLRPGSVNWGNPHKTSYLLNIRLVVAREDLKERFEFQGTMPEDVLDEFKTNYRAALAARRKGK